MDTTDPKQLREMREQTELLLHDETAAYRRLVKLVEEIKLEEVAAAEAGWGRGCDGGGQSSQASSEGVPPGRGGESKR